jgi:hypothetical protein
MSSSLEDEYYPTLFCTRCGRCVDVLVNTMCQRCWDYSITPKTKPHSWWQHLWPFSDLRRHKK